jgi:hypothetical protein
VSVRYFAVLHKHPDGMHGYPLDYYPEEHDRYRAALPHQIIGDFATLPEAVRALVEAYSRELKAWRS